MINKAYYERFSIEQLEHCLLKTFELEQKYKQSIVNVYDKNSLDLLHETLRTIDVTIKIISNIVSTRVRNKFVSSPYGDFCLN